MGSGVNPWQLKNFEESLDEWISLESPDDDQRLIVTAWVLSRFDDPYQGARREPGFENLWFGAVPGLVDAADDGMPSSGALSDTLDEIELIDRM